MVESQYLRAWRQEYQNMLCKVLCHTNMERVCRMESSVSLLSVSGQLQWPPSDAPQTHAGVIHLTLSNKGESQSDSSVSEPYTLFQKNISHNSRQKQSGFLLSFFFFFPSAVFSVWDKKKRYCQMCKCKFNECVKKSLQINAKIFHTVESFWLKKKGGGGGGCLK